jgi:MFS family permease
VASASGGFAGAIVLYETALGLGIAVGPLLGGTLGEISWRGPFYGVSVLMAIALIATVVLIEPTPKAFPRDHERGACVGGAELTPGGRVGLSSRVRSRRNVRSMLDAFYGAFSPACFALLGLWLVVVQIRINDWRGSSTRTRMSYVIALNFVLPGLMGVLALVEPQNAAFWRVSFAIIAAGGAVGSFLVRGFPTGDRLGAAAYWTAIALYAVIAILAIIGGTDLLRTEAVLLTALIFLDFNVAWLLLFSPAADPPAAG